jgi:ABC-type multidrug transport system fused ATPase/permease subunit
MSEKDLPSAKPPVEKLSLDLEAQLKQREKLLGSLVERLKPWLFEFGNWIFGGLIAFNLVIVAPLITMGPAHPEILVSIAIFACALPLDVSGLISLKLVNDIDDVAIDDMMRQAFEEAEVPNVAAHLLPSDDDQSLHKKRTDVALRYSTRLAALSAVLTLLGMFAALWYIAWWVALLFLIMVIASLVMTMNIAARLMRPDSETVKELRRRRQAQSSEQSNNSNGIP